MSSGWVLENRQDAICIYWTHFETDIRGVVNNGTSMRLPSSTLERQLGQPRGHCKFVIANGSREERSETHHVSYFRSFLRACMRGLVKGEQSMRL